MTEPLYRRVLGAEFARLPAAVRRLHDVREPARWAGIADVATGRHPFCRAIARVFRLPPAGQGQPITVSFTPTPDGTEIWARQFGGGTFRSVQRAGGSGIEEQVGLARLDLALHVDAGGLTLDLRRLTVAGIPMPRWLTPRIATSEAERDGRYTFDVAAELPGFGLLVRYSGWLEPS